jgi:hypothetical protein
MRVDDQKSRLKLQLELLKLKQARERAEQRAKKKEEERVEPPKAIIFCQEGLEDRAVWNEYVNGELVKREEILLE